MATSALRAVNDVPGMEHWGAMKPSVARFWARFYPSQTPLFFTDLVKSYVRPEHDVLEVGAGAGALVPHGIRDVVNRLVGIDPDPRVIDNTELSEGFVSVAEDLPFEDSSFDLIFHLMVAEHLPDPLGATQEAARVLKPGGRLMVFTPNKNHYSMIISRLTPQWFHDRFMAMIGSRPDADDVHPVHYLMNSEEDMRRMCAASGLKVERLEYRSGPPGYLRFSVPTFLAGTAWERFIERPFASMRAQILLVAIKPE